MKFLEEGAKINAKASQGVSFIELREQVANAKAVYDLARSTWPDSFLLDCRADFDKAIEGWDLTLDIWKLKLTKSDEPAEPNINGYLKFTAYAGEKLVVRPLIFGDYRGVNYLPFDENISVLLAVAGSSFNEGRDKILQALR